MRIAFLHLSDFHIKHNIRISSDKIYRIVACLNAIQYDSVCILLTGDLAQSGKKEEYAKFKCFQGQLFSALKEQIGDQYIYAFSVPGNHDICFPDVEETRSFEDIEKLYKDDNIESIFNSEFDMLDNYFDNVTNLITPWKGQFAFSYIANIGNTSFQVNLINTAPLSTRHQNNKELHIFPEEELNKLHRKDNTSFCITLMHHNWEWFNWRYKTNLEKTIVNNSEFVFSGHEHVDENRSVSLDNSNYIWMSAAGEMRIDDVNARDSFNIVIVDTDDETFESYQYEWNANERIYVGKTLAENKIIPKHRNTLQPSYSFIQDVKHDEDTNEDDFTKYYVFPKISPEIESRVTADDEINSIEDLKHYIEEHRRIIVTGASNSGKTSLLKQLYFSYINEKTPLFLSVDRQTKISKKRFIKDLFEENYGDTVPFDKYQQLDKKDKILIIDGWDLLKTGKNDELIINSLIDDFGFIVFSVSSNTKSSIDSIKESMNEGEKFFELHIRPFYYEKRNELVEKACNWKNIPFESIAVINHTIDSIVRNNSELFVLNPSFILKYVNYYSSSPEFDYVKGEAVFSEVYKLELYQAITLVNGSKDNLDEILTAFEELAGYMFYSRNDVVDEREFKEIILNYSGNYGVDISPALVLDVGLKSRILVRQEDLTLYFSNKNHLTFFIARYLLRECQGNPTDSEGIQYALSNICFGINSDIILFVSYFINSNTLINSILRRADELLSDWEPISLNSNNISILSLSSKSIVAPPTDAEESEYRQQIEKREELQYSEDVVEARGIFEYDENDIDLFQYELLRAIRYTEMICRILPSFHTTTTIAKKRQYIDRIYDYPRRIIYALLRPIDIHFDELCAELLSYAKDNNIKNKNNEDYSVDDIKALVYQMARGSLLGLYDHFSELCTNPKTANLLCEHEAKDSSEKIEKIMIIGKSGDHESLIKETEKLLKSKVDNNVKLMAKLIVRQHLLDNKNIPKNVKQSMIDRILGVKSRKNFIDSPTKEGKKQK